MKRQQQRFFKNENKSYGGELYRKRNGRGPRPLDTKNSMHLISRSSEARGEWSLLKPENKELIKRKIDHFSRKYGIQILSFANVGMHLHFHFKLSNRFSDKPFIRAITAAIAMGVTGKSRWNKIAGKFWDLRPFTRVIIGFRAVQTIKNYLEINKLEGLGVARELAEWIVKRDRGRE